MGENRKNYDIAFEHYRGQRRYIVTHPEHSGALVVAAPDEVAAIVAAAKKWQARWQSFEFYAFCNVVIYNGRNTSKTEGTD
jgi:hypothetical protein